MRPGHRQCLRTGGRLGDDQEVVLQGQQRGERAPDQMLVVGEQQPDGVRGPGVVTA
ncbi:hypothetical protein ACR6C2_22725 [Streptomyces sp. INA 01156]